MFLLLSRNPLLTNDRSYSALFRVACIILTWLVTATILCSLLLVVAMVMVVLLLLVLLNIICILVVAAAYDEAVHVVLGLSCTFVLAIFARDCPPDFQCER